MPKVKIYSTSTCVYCQAEKDFLVKHGIEFHEYLVDSDRAALEEMIKLSGEMAVPFTYIVKDNGEKFKILGFNQSAIAKALGIE
jgi:glutaredoxin